MSSDAPSRFSSHAMPNLRAVDRPPETHYIQPDNKYIWEFLRQNWIWVHECQYHEAELDYDNKQLYYTMQFKPMVELHFLLHTTNFDSTRVTQMNCSYLKNMPDTVGMFTQWGQLVADHLAHDQSTVWNYVWMINGKGWLSLHQMLSNCALIKYDHWYHHWGPRVRPKLDVQVRLYPRPEPIAAFLAKTIWSAPWETHNRNAERILSALLTFLDSAEGIEVKKQGWWYYDLWGQIEQHVPNPSWGLPFNADLNWLLTYVQTFQRALSLLRHQQGRADDKQVVELINFFGPSTLTEQEWINASSNDYSCIKLLLKINPVAYCSMPRRLQHEPEYIGAVLKHHGFMYFALSKDLQSLPGCKIAALQSCQWLFGFDQLGLAHDPDILDHAALNEACDRWKHIKIETGHLSQPFKRPRTTQ